MVTVKLKSGETIKIDDGRFYPCSVTYEGAFVLVTHRSETTAYPAADVEFVKQDHWDRRPM